MLSVKAREAADTIFKVFGMTQLRIKPSLPFIFLIKKTLFCFSQFQSVRKSELLNTYLLQA